MFVYCECFLIDSLILLIIELSFSTFSLYFVSIFLINSLLSLISSIELILPLPIIASIFCFSSFFLVSIICE